MSLPRTAGAHALRSSRPRVRPTTLRPRPLFAAAQRQIHATPRLLVVKPFLLADIGEGITECQLIQWFVQPGARVEQFDKLCEVQSDKASVEITSPFDGVIKKLHYEPDDMAITGKPLVDIDIQSEISGEDAEMLGGAGEDGRARQAEGQREEKVAAERGREPEVQTEDRRAAPWAATTETRPGPAGSQGEGEYRRTLATPAVRHLTKQWNVDIVDVRGTGKDGRVLKEDVHRYVAERDAPTTAAAGGAVPAPTPTATTSEDRTVPLTNVQTQMFKAMTRSLQIPHFLYTCAADVGAITTLRTRLNAAATAPEQKLTHLAFILKAVSVALLHHPLLNASLDTRDPAKPQLTYRGAHHFGIAIDAPVGLVVPVVRNVHDLSITEIAQRLRDLSARARANKLTLADFSGATFTVSNIGSVGGGVVAPVISEPQVAILGVGRSAVVPAFDQSGALVQREELVLSWSADHRVVDGAECARCAERVKGLLEEPGRMIVSMR